MSFLNLQPCQEPFKSPNLNLNLLDVMKSVLTAVTEQWAVLEAFWAGSHLETVILPHSTHPSPDLRRQGAMAAVQSPLGTLWHRARLGSLGEGHVTMRPRITYSQWPHFPFRGQIGPAEGQVLGP